MIRAAGMMLITGRAGRALFLKRAPTSDHPGEWCFPGGQIEPNETAEEAAERETREEIGPTPHGNPQMWTRRIATDTPAPSLLPVVTEPEQVDFTTFIASVNDEFIPTLNDEHTAWTWASLTDPPEPLHPGCRIALDRLTMDELGVARAMAAGDLVSPQGYGNFWLFSIRITGTGLAFRAAQKDKKGKVLRGEEFCWRDRSIYLTDDFLARCNGLPVVFNHPETEPTLDSDEFNKRIVGTVFVPFIKGEDVWAIVKIWDQPTADLMASERVSTSPGVSFSPRVDTNRKVSLEDGSVLLIEGKPALLDHIAICDAGVWDKGGPPTGVSNDFIDNKEPIGMTEEEKAAADKARKDNDPMAVLDGIMSKLNRMDSRLDAMEMQDKARRDSEEKDRKDRARHDAARRDRFGHRKDGESYKDYKARHDADEMAMCDALEKDGCAKDKAKHDATKARHDAEEAERKDGGETFAKWAKEESEEPAHKDARKDSEEEERRKEEERKDRMRHDSALASENADLRSRLAALEGKVSVITAEAPASERDALAKAQSRADGVAGMFGERAAPPIPGETPLAYRKRILSRFQRHSDRFKDTRLDSLDEAVLGPIEDIVYADAATAARSPNTSAPGQLVEIVERDRAGRMITKYHGDIMSWMAPFMTGATVGRINRNPKA